MKIEGNQKELDAMVEFHKGNRVEGLRLQEEFAAEFRKEYKDKDHCPCLKACRYHGNCKECVAIHRAHQEHVPNCMRPLINKKLKLMSELTEHTLANEIEAPHEILRKQASQISVCLCHADENIWKFIHSYKELIQKAGAETELVYMKVSKELLQKRLYKRNQVLNANSPFVITDEILEHHYHAFQEPWGEGEKVILQKEDIMQYSKEESKAIWNQNAEFWDCAMGDESNDFHREVVRPKVTELLNPDPTDYILDIACGNGNYSAYLAEKAVSVLAFDYSEKMVELAKKRQKRYADHIEFCVADATNETSLMALKRNKPFTKAVSNMAIMDITDIKPLFTSVYKLLEDNGVFVFATQHPCFVTLTEKYMTPHSYYDIAIEGQPQKQCYYHRSLQDIFNLCFDTGFVIDGFYEECYFNKEIPDIIIVRAIKIERQIVDLPLPVIVKKLKTMEVSILII